MKKRLYIFVLLVATVVASGCSRTEAVDPVGSHAIGVDVVQTRTTSEFPLPYFGMYVYDASEDYYSNIQWTEVESVWLSTDIMFWPTVRDIYTVAAYAPYILHDPSLELPTAANPWAIAAGTDFVWYSKEVTPNALTDYKVPIIFDHKMSKLTVNLTLAGGIAGNAATVSIATKDGTFDGTTVELGTGADVTVSMTGTAGSYTNYIVPQTVSIPVTVTVTNGPTFAATIPSTTFVAGKSYAVSMTCTATALTVGTVTVGEWGTGGSFTIPNNGEDNLTE